MKRALFVLALMTGVLVACQRDTAIRPSALLFKRWQVYQGREVSSHVWTIPNPGTFYDLEFRQDGAVVYYKDSNIVAAPCCSGTRFERKGAFIQYKEAPVCPTVYCSANLEALILTLKDDLLELQTGSWITQYKPFQ